MRLLIPVLALSILGLTGCTAFGGAAQTVDVSVSEYSVMPASTPLKAGKFTFRVKNNGKEDHELEVSSQTGRDIPDAASLGEAEDIGPGETKSFTVDLKPGTYELACRLQDTKANPPFNHYDRGMHLTVSVQ